MAQPPKLIDDWKGALKLSFKVWGWFLLILSFEILQGTLRAYSKHHFPLEIFKLSICYFSVVGAIFLGISLLIPSRRLVPNQTASKPVLNAVWDEDKLSASTNGETATYSWPMVKRLYIFPPDAPGATAPQENINQLLIVEACESQQSKKLILTPQHLNLGTRSMSDVLQEMTQLRERALQNVQLDLTPASDNSAPRG